jgi:imidazolonepropionase
VKVLKNKADLIIKNGQIITCSKNSEKPKLKEEMGNIGIIENGAVAVNNEEIIWVGKAEDLEKEVEITCKTKTIDASGKTVLPGLVDPHTHLVFGGSREHELELKLQGVPYLDILAQGGGILSTVRSTREASKESLIASGMKYADQMLAQGTTTAEAKSGYGLTTEQEIKQLEAIKEINEQHELDLVPTFLGAHAIPEDYKGKADEFIDLVIEEMLPEVKKRGLAEFCDIFCENKVFSAEQSRKVLGAAKEMGFKLKIHSDEIESLGGTAVAAELRAVSADHLLVTTDEDIKKMAESGVCAVVLPGTTFNLREDHYAPARKMLQEGAAVALATDFNPGSCPTNNLQLIMTIGCLYLEMTPAEVINAVTINAAHAIDKAEKIGSIEKGKQADIVIFDAPNYKYLPYRFGTNLVEKVIKKGRVVIGGEN